MLSLETTRREELYGYRNNCFNVAWVAGLVRSIDAKAGTGVLHRSNNPNQGIPFAVKDGDRIPSDLVGLAAGLSAKRKIIARMHGTTNDRGLPSIKVVAMSFTRPNVVEMPPSSAFQSPLRPGIPDVVGADPKDFPSDDALQRDRRILRDLRSKDTGNVCKVSGYIQAYNYTPPRVKLEGGNTEAQIEILIRQTEDPRDLIPVVLRGRMAKKTADSLSPRDPVFVMGRLETIIKNVGAADEAGVIPISTRVVVRTDEIQTPDDDDITFRPAWIESIPVDRGSRRSRTPPQGEAGGAPLIVEAPAIESNPAPSAVPAELLELMAGTPAA